MFVSLLFLVARLIYSPSFVHPVFAAAPDPCFGDNCRDSGCVNNLGKLTASCCWTCSNGKFVCQTYEVNMDTGDFENCTNPSSKVKLGSSVIAPPPSTTTCPENTAVDANGNCAPVTQAPKESPPPSTDQQGTTQPTPPTVDNTPYKHNLPKGGSLELPQIGGESTANKKGSSNNDNSATPPACPDKGPIPPDCTLKPKF